MLLNTTKKPRILSYLLIFCLLSLSTPTITYAATPDSYQIELIAYSQINNDSLSKEQWPFYSGKIAIPETAVNWSIDQDGNNIPYTSDPSSINNAPTSSASTSSTSTSGTSTSSTSTSSTSTNNPNQESTIPELTQVDKSKWQLNNAAKRIQRSKRYQLILHTAFIVKKSAMQQKPGIVIHLQGGQPLTDNTEMTAFKESDSDNSSNANTTLNGLISIYLERYFNVNINMAYRVPTSQLTSVYSDWNENNQWGDTTAFHIIESRRMRSKELNYLDSPILGMLVIIEPVASEQVDSEQVASEQVVSEPEKHKT